MLPPCPLAMCANKPLLNHCPCTQALNDHHALLEGTLLKPNMVLAGER